jgi:hypothetical protein
MATLVARAERLDRGREPEWAVWLTVALALILGFILMTTTLNSSTAATEGGSTINYPSTWVKTTEAGADFAAADLNNGGPYAPRIALRQLDKKALLMQDGSASDAAAGWSLKRGEDLVGYRVLGVHPTKVGNKDAADVESAYLMESRLGSSTNVMPGLMHAVDTVVLGSDNKYYILTFAAESSQFDSLKSVRDNVLSGWKVP